MQAAFVRKGLEISVILCSLFVLLPASAHAQNATLEFKKPAAELALAYDQLRSAWKDSKPAFQKALFITTPATGYGQYTPRPTSTFASSENIFVYLEPVGYGLREKGSQTGYSLKADFRLLTPDGQLLTSQSGFVHLENWARSPQREIFASLNFEFSGLPAGNYQLEIDMRDQVKNKTATIKLPFTSLAAD